MCGVFTHAPSSDMNSDRNPRRPNMTMKYQDSDDT